VSSTTIYVNVKHSTYLAYLRPSTHAYHNVPVKKTVWPYLLTIALLCAAS
jgi:hypothetical protein